MALAQAQGDPHRVGLRTLGPALRASRPTDLDLPRLRPVLKGVLFRSGTPSEAGLLRLCREGFKRVYSLYGARTSDKQPQNDEMLRRGLDQRSCVVGPTVAAVG